MGIVACAEKMTISTTPNLLPSTESETSAPTTTAPPSTTGTFPLAESTKPVFETPTITSPTLNYCGEQIGMGQPLVIQAEQVSFKLAPGEGRPSGDINPTIETSGVDLPSKATEIIITMVESTVLTTIYIPTNRPGQSTNVIEFTVVIIDTNSTVPIQFTSVLPSSSEPTTTALSTAGGVVLPSDNSPQVKLTPDFELSKDSTITIRDIKTTDGLSPTGVRSKPEQKLCETTACLCTRC